MRTAILVTFLHLFFSSIFLCTLLQCILLIFTVLYCTVVLYCTGVFYCIQYKMPLRWAACKNKIQFNTVLAYFVLNCTVLYFSNTENGPLRAAPINPGQKTAYSRIGKCTQICVVLPQCGAIGPTSARLEVSRKLLGTVGAAAGRMPTLQNGPLRAAPINPGKKTAHGGVQSNLCCLALAIVVQLGTVP